MEEDELTELRDNVIRTLRPMEEFVKSGFLYLLNRDYMIPNGRIIAMYTDDEGGQTSLGWACLPLDLARDLGVVPTQDTIDQRQAAFDKFEC